MSAILDTLEALSQRVRTSAASAEMHPCMFERELARARADAYRLSRSIVIDAFGAEVTERYRSSEGT